MTRISLVASFALLCASTMACEEAFADAHSQTVSVSGLTATYNMRVTEMDRRDRLVELDIYGGQPMSTLFVGVSHAPNAEANCVGRCMALEEPLVSVTELRFDEDGEAWLYVPWSVADADRAFYVQAWSGDDASEGASRVLRVDLP